MTDHRHVTLFDRYEPLLQLAGTCTNAGDSGDDADLYHVLDQLLTEVQAHHPPFACRAGCSRCCHVSPPLVLGVEWQAIHGHLLQAPAKVRQQVLDMAALLRPLAGPLATMRELAIAERPVPNDFGYQCPLLIDGKCSVYEARPLVCRAYGYVYRVDTETRQAQLLMSDLAMAFLKATWHGVTSELPVINPYTDQLQALNRQIGGGAAFLPQWLWAHLDDGVLAPTCQVAPDFSAVAGL